jgi:hypothetical protein
MGLDTKTYWLTDRQSQCDFKAGRVVAAEAREQNELELGVQEVGLWRLILWLEDVIYM